jgi:hypothetical protein
VKTKYNHLAIASWLLLATLQSHSQGFIVPNGVVYAGLHPFGYEVDVLRDPTNSYYTGFWLKSLAQNTFSFDKYADVGVRVFLVSANDPISLQPILSLNYPELATFNSYVFVSGIPFYVGLYTGNQPFAPPDGIYSDPLFGWARLVNNNGVIQLLDSALAYKAGGIYAGTQNLIPVPEPSTTGLIALGALLLGWRLRKKRVAGRSGR